MIFHSSRTLFSKSFDQPSPSGFRSCFLEETVLFLQKHGANLEQELQEMGQHIVKVHEEYKHQRISVSWKDLGEKCLKKTRNSKRKQTPSTKSFCKQKQKFPNRKMKVRVAGGTRTGCTPSLPHSPAAPSPALASFLPTDWV